MAVRKISVPSGKGDIGVGVPGEFANAGDILEDDLFEGATLAASVAWFNRAYPPCLRINPSVVTPSHLFAVRQWAYDALSQGRSVAILRTSALKALGPSGGNGRAARS